jgi:hypothetical protein
MGDLAQAWAVSWATLPREGPCRARCRNCVRDENRPLASRAGTQPHHRLDLRVLAGPSRALECIVPPFESDGRLGD